MGLLRILTNILCTLGARPQLPHATDALARPDRASRSQRRCALSARRAARRSLMQDQRGSRAAQVPGHGIVGCHVQRGWDAGLAIGCSPVEGGKLRHFYLQVQEVRVSHPDAAWQSAGCLFVR